MRSLSSLSLAAALAGVLAISACASDGFGGRPDRGAPDRGGRAEVTRFFLAPDIARASVVVEPLDTREGSGPRFALIRGAVEDNLRAAGFRPVPQRDAAELVAVVGLTRAVRPSQAPDSSGTRVHGGFGVGGGGGRYGGVGGGVGLGISFGGKRHLRDTGVDTLSVSLRRRSDATVIWEGRAVGEANVERRGDPAESAFFLAHALFADFPGRSGVTVRYPSRRK